MENMTDYLDIEVMLDTMELLSMIKELVYMGGTSDLNRSHNKAITHMSSMNLHQERLKISRF